MITSIRSIISNKPWIWIVLLFIGLIVLWSWFITLAVRHQPEVIKIPETKHATATSSSHTTS